MKMQTRLSAPARTRFLGRRRGERGASLVLAVGFVALFGVISASLLSAEWTSSSASVAYLSAGSRRAAADGAVQTAIDWVKNQPTLGLNPASTNVCVLNVVTGVGTITTTCAGDTGSGQAPHPWVPINPRVVTFKACLRANTALTGDCGTVSGDTVLLQARVRFDVSTDASGNAAANVPEVLAWDHTS